MGLKLLHAEDSRPNANNDALWRAPRHLVRQHSKAIPPVGKLVAVPELPACFLAQPIDSTLPWLAEMNTKNLERWS